MPVVWHSRVARCLVERIDRSSKRGERERERERERESNEIWGDHQMGHTTYDVGICGCCTWYPRWEGIIERGSSLRDHRWYQWRKEKWREMRKMRVFVCVGRLMFGLRHWWGNIWWQTPILDGKWQQLQKRALEAFISHLYVMYTISNQHNRQSLLVLL